MLQVAPSQTSSSSNVQGLQRGVLDWSFVDITSWECYYIDTVAMHRHEIKDMLDGNNDDPFASSSASTRGGVGFGRVAIGHASSLLAEPEKIYHKSDELYLDPPDVPYLRAARALQTCEYYTLSMELKLAAIEFLVDRVCELDSFNSEVEHCLATAAAAATATTRMYDHPHTTIRTLLASPRSTFGSSTPLATLLCQNNSSETRRTVTATPTPAIYVGWEVT